MVLSHMLQYQLDSGPVCASSGTPSGFQSDAEPVTETSAANGVEGEGAAAKATIGAAVVARQPVMLAICLLPE